MIKRVMLRKVKEALQVGGGGEPQDLAQLHESHLGVVLKTFRCLLYPKHRADLIACTLFVFGVTQLTEPCSYLILTLVMSFHH